MNTELINALAICETDVDGALRRFSGNEALYKSYLIDFLEEPTMGMLNEAVKKRDWDDAFTAAHALKGLAGNMGFIPLYHATGELILLIRAGKTSEVIMPLKQIKNCYDDVVTAIHHCDLLTQTHRKENEDE